MYEQNDTLIQRFPDGKAMQVKLAPDRVDVRIRTVQGEKADDTESNTPHWSTAYGFILSEWMLKDSPVWRWLRDKGIDEIAARKRLLGLK
jgi:hypothetical protein